MNKKIVAVLCLSLLISCLALGALFSHPLGDRDYSGAAPDGTRVTSVSPNGDRDAPSPDGTRVTLVTPGPASPNNETW
ncbi:MAG TPA: hypothetical protein VKR06_39045 [Ktedonosporobacter sp.]|nr:hypothetical protein [Ktedonosporobacter sp.]